jgi:hypothetical protein
MWIMTAGLALEYISRRMKELCHGDNYHIRFRHFIVANNETYIINAHNHLYIILEPYDGVVESDTGLFEYGFEGAREMQYEHQGEIRLTNVSGVAAHFRFIQVIPKC